MTHYQTVKVTYSVWKWLEDEKICDDRKSFNDVILNALQVKEKVERKEIIL